MEQAGESPGDWTPTGLRLGPTGRTSRRTNFPQSISPFSLPPPRRFANLVIRWQGASRIPNKPTIEG